MPKKLSIQEAASAEFHMTLGFCITAWAKVEERLFEICAKCLGSTEERIAIVYYRTPGLDVRLKLIDELVRTALPIRSRKNGGKDHPSVIAWNDLRKKIENLLLTRRRLAHHPIRQTTVIIRATNAKNAMYQMSELESHVSRHELLRGRSGHLKDLSIADLEAHHIAVLAIARELDEFYSETLLVHFR